MNKKKIVFILSSIWALIIGLWILQSEMTLRTGQEILLKTIPVDPRDILMGDYVILRYEISQISVNNQACGYGNNKSVYVSINTDKNNIGTMSNIYSTKPSGGLFIKGKCKSNSEITYGIESYYVKEGTGLKLEKDLRNGALVKVAVDKNGNAKVKEFIKNNN